MKKSQLKEYFIQIFIVVIGVFLGMLASDWSSNKNLRNSRKALLKSIKNELTSNLEKLKKMEADRKPFYVSHDSLSQLLTADILNERFNDRSFNERLPNWKGLGSANLEDAMFEAAKYSDVLIGMDIQLLEQLSKTYSRQEGINKLYDLMLNRFYAINSQSLYKEIDLLIWQVRQELWGGQILLMEEYKKAINMI